MVLEKTLESPLDCKEIQPIHAKGNQFWIFIGRTDAETETPILGHMMWRTDSLEKTLMLGNIEGRRKRDRGWDGCMASLIQWTWAWVNSGSWWWTGRPGVLQFMGSQRVGHDWATELNWPKPLQNLIPYTRHTHTQNLGMWDAQVTKIQFFCVLKPSQIVRSIYNILKTTEI